MATERNEMVLSGFLKSFQTPRHKGKLRSETTPLKPKSGLNWATRPADRNNYHSKRDY